MHGGDDGVDPVDPRDGWSPTARRLGIASSNAMLALGFLYLATIVLWLLVVAKPHEPVGDPFLAVMEILTILSALAGIPGLLDLRPPRSTQ